MKGLLLIGIFMFYSISSVWGQDVIKQYAGTAMLYPVQEDSFHLSTSDMEPGSQLQGRHWIRLKKHLYWGNRKTD